MRIMPEQTPQVNSHSLDLLFAYASTHAHSRQWIPALLIILQRKGGAHA
jgi:hypothetical protein